MSKRGLFVLWGVLFVLCAGLGFAPEPGGLTLLAALAFFVPPAVLLLRFRDSHTLKLVRNLAALSLGLTLVLLILSFATALSTEAVGNLLHSILVVVSCPMICSGHWAASLFLWACLLMVSMKLLRECRK